MAGITSSVTVRTDDNGCEHYAVAFAAAMATMAGPTAARWMGGGGLPEGPGLNMGVISVCR